MTHPLTETVAGEVRAELARQNISRAKAAGWLGMSRVALWNRLRGETSFSLGDLQILANELHVPLTNFLPESSERVA